MFYDSVSLNGPHGQLIRVIGSECVDIEYCDVHGYDVLDPRDVIDEVTNRRAVGTFLYGHYRTLAPKSLSFRDI